MFVNRSRAQVPSGAWALFSFDSPDCFCAGLTTLMTLLKIRNVQLTTDRDMTSPGSNKRRKWTPESFVEFCISKYGDKYDYSNTVFLTVNKRISVRCRIHDCVFTPFAHDHLRGRGGCPRCKADATGERIRALRGITRESFLERARKVHGDKYDYSRAVIGRSVDKIEVICPIHQISFFPTIANHLNNGTGCPECGREAIGKKHALSLKEFIARAKEVHGDKYDYSLVSFDRLHDKVRIICSKHGEFTQLAYDHLGGHGCEKCGGLSSEPVQEILTILESYGLEALPEVALPNGSKLDIYIPSLRIAIEYNGLRWHTEEFRSDRKYHLKKTLEANQYGIHLIHIWEDDWVFGKEKTISWLKSQLGLSDRKFNARDLEVRLASMKEIGAFVDKHHMQGKPSACELCYGLYTKEGVLVAAMMFSSKNCPPGEICLERFCSDGHVRGGFSKLLSAFKREHGSRFEKIVSFSDRSWSTGEVYRSTGFTLVGHGEPRYWWVRGQRRYDRRAFQRKELRKRLETFDETLSEAENCRRNGYRKLYDCGVTKWELKL